jgi:hypothetical protein
LACSCSAFQFGFVPDISLFRLNDRNGKERFVLRFLKRFASTLVLTLTLFSVFRLEPAFAAPQEGSWQGTKSAEAEAAKSEAAEAWDAVKTTTNPALLEAFIKRYRTTFFADMAKARLSELKAATNSPADQRGPAAQPMPANGIRERAILYEEMPSDPTGRQFDGSVIWRAEAIKVDGKPDEIAARADVEIPSRGLRMTMLLKRNLDSSLPASHVIDLKLAPPADFDGGGIASVPGILLKSNQQAKGVPLAGTSIKVTNGLFLVGLSSLSNNPERNLKLLLERSWFDIPMVYANQRRVILAIDKGETGDQVFKTVLTVWEPYSPSTQPTTPNPKHDDGTSGAR